MPSNLTGYSLGSVYTCFLHLSTTGITQTLERVFDGTGTGSCLYISTSSIAVSGTTTINGLTYPDSAGATNTILTSDGSGNIVFRSLNYLLTAANASTAADGNYSNPVITMKDGVIQNIYSNGATKQFMVTSRNVTQAGPSTTSLQQAIQWAFPIIGDIAYVMQKVYSGATMVELDIYKFTYTAQGWGQPLKY